MYSDFRFLIEDDIDRLRLGLNDCHFGLLYRIMVMMSGILLVLFCFGFLVFSPSSFAS